MAYETILCETKENILTITMNRPEKMNAINKAMWDELMAELGRAEKDPEVRAIILAGSGKAFCSGWDVKDSYYLTPPDGEEKFTTASALTTMKGISGDYLKIFNLRKPTIAKVTGYCLAAGIYLEMLCDVGIASEDAVFGHPVASGPDSMPLFVWLMGIRKAKQFLMTRRFISGKEAERMDLVNMAVPAEKLDEEVWTMATEMAAVPTDSGLAHGQAILKENINTDAEIMGLSALFSYHRQLNAMAHIGSGAAAEDAAPAKGKKTDT